MVDGVYGVTVNTGVCGALDSGSIPDRHPNYEFFRCKKNLVSYSMYLIYKKRGELLSDLVARARMEKCIPEHESVTYAGRLDPMAEGLVILLVGRDEIVTHKNDFLALPKEYEFEILLGIATDTQDVLGVVDRCYPRMVTKEEIQKACGVYAGKTFVQKYPKFSSKPVRGKPLFMWVKENLDVQVPSHEVSVYTLNILTIRKVHVGDIASKNIDLIQKVNGDFRQDLCIASWKKYEASNELCSVVSVRVRVSSGTYIRQLAYDIGEQLGVPASALSICRTAIGDYRVE